MQFAFPTLFRLFRTFLSPLSLGARVCAGGEALPSSHWLFFISSLCYFSTLAGPPTQWLSVVHFFLFSLLFLFFFFFINAIHWLHLFFMVFAEIINNSVWLNFCILFTSCVNLYTYMHIYIFINIYICTYAYVPPTAGGCQLMVSGRLISRLIFHLLLPLLPHTCHCHCSVHSSLFAYSDICTIGMSYSQSIW